MPGAHWPRRMVLLGLLGVVVAALAVPCILLARDTTSHDWQSAAKLTVEEVMLAVGKGRYDSVTYRWADGDTWKITRAAFVEFGPPVEARQRILATVGDGVMLGAGVGGTVFCLMLLGAASLWRRGRTGTALEPVEHSHGHLSAADTAGRIVELIRPGLRMRIALLVVSPADLERLLAPPGPTRRPGFVDLPEPNGVELVQSGHKLLERRETPSLPSPTRPAGLPSPERAESGPGPAIAAEPAAADPGSRPDNREPAGMAGDKAAAPRRKPGEEFF